MITQNKPRFSLGRIVATPGAIEAMNDSGDTPIQFLSRHVRGDWGEVCDEDKQLNEESLVHGGRLLSVYQTKKNVTIWLITEADRSVSTLLLPSEY